MFTIEFQDEMMNTFSFRSTCLTGSSQTGSSQNLPNHRSTQCFPLPTSRLSSWRPQLSFHEQRLDAVGPQQLNPAFLWTCPCHPSVKHNVPGPRVQRYRPLKKHLRKSMNIMIYELYEHENHQIYRSCSSQSEEEFMTFEVVQLVLVD